MTQPNQLYFPLQHNLANILLHHNKTKFKENYLKYNIIN